MNKVLVQYRLNCHYGDIEGIFVSTNEELEASYGETAMFGDVWNDMEDRDHGLRPYCKDLVQTEEGYKIEVRN